MIEYNIEDSLIAARCRFIANETEFSVYGFNYFKLSIIPCNYFIIDCNSSADFDRKFNDIKKWCQKHYEKTNILLKLFYCMGINLIVRHTGGVFPHYIRQYLTQIGGDKFIVMSISLANLSRPEFNIIGNWAFFGRAKRTLQGIMPNKSVHSNARPR
ncbi:MAG: hypothetical protein AMK70_04275 [Nitrospira bacterium SG8_35_1]|nr:MAG: hypothetical protein AMK70_04275 [Nitrospira bacterium SG8_35_1]